MIRGFTATFDGKRAKTVLREKKGKIHLGFPYFNFLGGATVTEKHQCKKINVLHQLLLENYCTFQLFHFALHCQFIQ